ncbi:MAG: hypothetical protein ACK41T_08705 [Pseudobdellovibrio sp.]
MLTETHVKPSDKVAKLVVEGRKHQKPNPKFKHEQASKPESEEKK